MRLNVSCPEAMIDDANDLAMALGEGPADASTYGAATWQDAAGNLYTVASFPNHLLHQDPAQAIDRPAWDVEPYGINMTGAQRAQAALVIWTGPGDDPGNPIPIPHASPDAITVVAGGNGQAALAAMGLVAIPQEDEHGA
jgi:hypothetical protein